MGIKDYYIASEIKDRQLLIRSVLPLSQFIASDYILSDHSHIWYIPLDSCLNGLSTGINYVNENTIITQ